MSTHLKRWLAGFMPALGAIVVALVLWELIVFSGWRPDYILPGPRPVFARMWEELQNGEVWQAVQITLGRAAQGFALAIALGSALGFAMSKLPWVRSAFKGVITGLQTMPSVAWFPLALVLFQGGEASIMFVVVLGAAPSIAVGLLSAFDHVQPLLVRVGRSMGARGLGLYRHVIVPAALPGYVSGLKQGWAFSWRSLMAGELIATMTADNLSIGQRLHYSRDMSDYSGLIAWMIVVLAIGILVDLVVFARIELYLRRGRGLVEDR
jgi:NitT/TauT family transport system permease protein